MKTILDRLDSLDRRIIFLLIGAAIVIPLIFKTAIIDTPSEVTLAVFDEIDKLPEGSRVLLSFDYDPPSAPELHPMSVALVRHALLRNQRMVFMALWPMGEDMANQIIHNVIEKEFPEKRYGIDYVNLGYKAGLQVVINTILSNLGKIYTHDSAGHPIDELALLKDVKKLKDFALIADISAGYPGLKEWIQFGSDPSEVPIVGGCTAVTAPQIYPYYPAQIRGILAGLKGAAEYESALYRSSEKYRSLDKHLGIQRMGPQTFAHMVIIILIVIGNITFFLRRRRGVVK